MNTPADHDVRMRRALRSLEGLSVGDAFGEQLLAQPSTVFRRMEARDVMPGMWAYSDDTVMAMSIVETLQRHGGIDQAWLAARFAKKYQLDPTRGYGTMAHMILAEIARGRDWRQAAGAAFGGRGSMGNGGAMRAAPVGAYFAGDLSTAAAQARLSAEVTHAHAEGQAGAMAVAPASSWIAAGRSDASGLSPPSSTSCRRARRAMRSRKPPRSEPTPRWTLSSTFSAMDRGCSRRTLYPSPSGAPATT
jgi:ADP-ribosylglycohydrolase